MKTFKLKISDEAFDLLELISGSYAEYKDTQYGSLDDFKNSNEYKSGLKTVLTI